MTQLPTRSTNATSQPLAPAAPRRLSDLVQVAPEAIVSRTLVKNAAGSVTLFAFDEGQSLSEHTAPFDALVQVVQGSITVTIGGAPHGVGVGELVLMPAGVPHAVRADAPSIMQLTMLRAPASGG